MAMVVIQGVGGGGTGKPEEEKEVSLSMQNGDQIVVPSSGRSLSKVTIKKPTTLIPENIRKDTVVCGVTGTLESGGVAMPTLNAVSITRNGALFTISNPSTNGNFVNGYKIYGNGVLNDTITGTSYELKLFPAGSVTVMVKAKGNNFNDGRESNTFSCSIYTIDHVLNGLTASNTDERIADGLEFLTVLRPETGKYLPEFIDVTMGGQPVEYTYDSYTGRVRIAKTAGDIVVTATAYEQPKLRTPEVALDDPMLTMSSPRYSRQLDLYVDGVVVKTYEEYAEVIVEAVSGAQYGFEQNAAGYYESKNKGKDNTYALCKVVISISNARKVVFRCRSIGEANYDYGILSKLDTELTLSAAPDPAQNVQKSFTGPVNTSIQTVVYEVPVGEHFIYVKYRKDGGGAYGADTLQFVVDFEE